MALSDVFGPSLTSSSGPAVAHDYYIDTKIASPLVTRSLRLVTVLPSKYDYRNSHYPGGVAAKAGGYVTEQLTEATFQQFLSISENFYFDLLPFG